MDIKVQIETGETCDFKLLDITGVTETGYLPEESEGPVTLNRFKYSDTMGIAVLELINSKGESKLLDPTFMEHCDKPEWCIVPTNFDSHFILHYIVLPTALYVSTLENISSTGKTIYFTDGEKFYSTKTNISDAKECPISLIIGINPVNTSISKYENDYMSICFLKKCFISLCQLIFELRGFGKCAYKGKIDENLIYNRDLIWMTINIISYLTEFGQLNEAQRILELILNCNGICKSRDREVTGNGCGCS